MGAAEPPGDRGGARPDPRKRPHLRHDRSAGREVNPATTMAQVQLTEHDGGTRMEVRSVFDTREQLVRLGATEVFVQTVGRMDALLAG